MSVRFKRLIAFVIDWNITWFPVLLVFSFVVNFLTRQSEINPLIVLLLFLIMLLALAAFVLRDVIFKGRSLGKRILGLYIYDKNSLKPARVGQCFLRDIFLFLYVIDGILLLATGETIGDRAAGTLVMTKQRLETYTQEIQIASPVPKKRKVKKIIIASAIILACLVAFIGLIQFVLNTQKDTEEYKIAYSYFVESKAFKDLNVDESKIRFNNYSSQTYTAEGSDSVSQTVEIGFTVKFRPFKVVCHKENGIWRVCDECTLFE